MKCDCCNCETFVAKQWRPKMCKCSHFIDNHSKLESCFSEGTAVIVDLVGKKEKGRIVGPKKNNCYPVQFDGEKKVWNYAEKRIERAPLQNISSHEQSKSNSDKIKITNQHNTPPKIKGAFQQILQSSNFKRNCSLSSRLSPSASIVSNDEHLDEEVKMSGYLYKRGTMNTTWKQRYWELRGNYLLYFVDQYHDTKKGRIDLEKADLEFRIDNIKNEFQIIATSRTYNLRAKTREEMEKWIDALSILWERIKIADTVKINDDHQNFAGQIGEIMRNINHNEFFVKLKDCSVHKLHKNHFEKYTWITLFFELGPKSKGITTKIFINIRDRIDTVQKKARMIIGRKKLLDDMTLFNATRFGITMPNSDIFLKHTSPIGSIIRQENDKLWIKEQPKTQYAIISYDNNRGFFVENDLFIEQIDIFLKNKWKEMDCAVIFESQNKGKTWSVYIKKSNSTVDQIIDVHKNLLSCRTDPILETLVCNNPDLCFDHAKKFGAGIEVYIIAGKNLPVGDLNGKSDPYCKVMLNNNSDISKKTKIIRKNLNPKWDERITFSYGEIEIADNDWESIIVNIDVYDWDRWAQDDFLGSVKIPLKDLCEDRPQRTEYPLQQSKNSFLSIAINYCRPSFAKQKPNFHFGNKLEKIQSLSLLQYTANIPKILIQLQDYLVKKDGLKSAGIFRKSPASNDVYFVKVQLNLGKFQECEDIHCIARLIKDWFHDLPTRLLSCPHILELVTSPTQHNQKSVQSVLKAMKDPFKSLLEWLLDLCVDVCVQEKINRMSPQALAIVFTPNLIPRTDDLEKELVYNSKTISFLTEAIIHRQDLGNTRRRR